MSQYLKGIAASPGITIGKAYMWQQENWDIPHKDNADVEQESHRFRQAVQQSMQEIQQIFEQVQEEIGEEQAEIFEGHLFVLQDPEWVNMVMQKIESEQVNAEWALDQITKQLVESFEAMDSAYMRERSADIRDVSDRVMGHLFGKKKQVLKKLDSPTIIIAHDLTPSDTIQFKQEAIQGLATNIGGRTSHTAIMANSLEIPAVVGLQQITEQVVHGQMIILDGLTGKVIIDPTSEQQLEYEKKRQRYGHKQSEWRRYVDQPTVTADGHQVELAANIGTPDDIEGVLRNGAEGIGLFRTEFLYMNRDQFPDEEEQLIAYQKVAEAMEGKPVVIRTLDIGGDKKLPFLEMPKEMNPFLGYRAIRLCLDRPEIFRPQLRAILRASQFGNIKLMYPMISTVEEVRAANQLLEECKEELRQEGVSFSSIEVGIMVETPAAAIIADQLAQEVDFFSIGTNDLVQYTLACDRMNEKISDLYQSYHPAVLRLIDQIIRAAHRHGKWVGMCGEMAGDPLAIPILLGLGLDEFSMSASSILANRQWIHQLDHKDTQQLAMQVMQLESQLEVKRWIQEQIQLPVYEDHK